MVDLGTLGGTSSYATSVSADGLVIVGSSTLLNDQNHAFKYASGAMVDLGALDGINSYLSDISVSADASVLVGNSFSLIVSNVSAFKINLQVTDVEAWMSSISGQGRIYNAGTTLASLPMEGAHHRPMLAFDRLGKEKQAWATGDFGRSSRTRDVEVTISEAGINYLNSGKTGLVGLGKGYGKQTETLTFNGSSTIKGDYTLAEYDYQFPQGLVSVIGMVGSWQSEINRGYLNGVTTDNSFGIADITTRSLRLRIDAPSLTGLNGLEPYASYSETRTNVDAYTETGGAFPSSYDRQKNTAREGRLGVTGAKDLGVKSKLLYNVEAVHRFDGVGPSLAGTDITGGVTFNLPGTAPRSNWFRFGFDIDHKLGEKTLLNLSAHAATAGENQDLAGAINIRQAF
jgi:probable HAF family extracellular repeat protein